MGTILKSSQTAPVTSPLASRPPFRDGGAGEETGLELWSRQLRQMVALQQKGGDLAAGGTAQAVALKAACTVPIPSVWWGGGAAPAAAVWWHRGVFVQTFFQTSKTSHANNSNESGGSAGQALETIVSCFSGSIRVCWRQKLG